MKSRLVYKTFERFWHWTQALLILLLMLTGFEIHGSLAFFGYAQAVRLHSVAAIAFLVLIAFAVFWHATTGEWRHYVPTAKNLRSQIEYYAIGIFRNAPHPGERTELSKLNPLQRIVYAGLKVLVIPLMVTTGLLYMFYRFPSRHGVSGINVGGLQGIAVLHTLGAFALVAFLIAHLYLMTTGRTVLSNLKAMVTGYEEVESPSGEAA